MPRPIPAATPKIGAYPFTTLTPNLGVCQTRRGNPVVVADIPGLIAGAHRGAGLGTQFLRHIKRTRFLVHLIDASSVTPDSPLEAYETLNAELSLYDRELGQKPQIVVLNKIDLPHAAEAARRFQTALKTKDVLTISALTGEGIERLTSYLDDMLERHDG